MAFAEFGDKTQLITIGLAAQHGSHPAIWVGESLAIVPVSAHRVFFWRVARSLNLAWVMRAAADIASKYVLGVSFPPF